MARFSTESARAKARKKAEDEYNAGWNLRPVKGAPDAFVDTLRRMCRESGSVMWATFAEEREDGQRAIRYLVGLRLRRNPPVSFGALAARLKDQLASSLPSDRTLQVTELDSDVDPTMVDDSPNPYVVYSPKLL